MCVRAGRRRCVGGDVRLCRFGRPLGALAFNREHSCDATFARDRFATNAVAHPLHITLAGYCGEAKEYR
jgi:hypothetical protein